MNQQRTLALHLFDIKPLYHCPKSIHLIFSHCTPKNYHCQTLVRENLYLESPSLFSSVSGLLCFCERCVNQTCNTSGLCFVFVTKSAGQSVTHGSDCLEKDDLHPRERPFQCAPFNHQDHPHCCNTHMCNKNPKVNFPGEAFLDKICFVFYLHSFLFSLRRPLSGCMQDFSCVVLFSCILPI